MFEIPLNKFEKEQKIIDWYLEGKTYREISKLHISFRDIKKIIIAYEKKIRLQKKKEEQENNQQTTTKKESLYTKSFKLFKEGKKPTETVKFGKNGGML